MLRLDFFDIEAQALDTGRLEEVVDFLRVSKSLAGNHGDNVEGNVVVLQQLEAAHRCPVAAVASPGLAVQIVKKIRSVNTKSDTDVVTLDKVAPPLV